MSFIYKENKSGPRTVPCDTPDKTGAHWNFAPLTTTLCCLLHRNESSYTSVSTYAISMEFASQKFIRRSVKGLLEVQYKCIYLTSCIQNFGPFIYYCDQLSFTATILPESMLPVSQKLVFIKMSHNICTYYMFKHLARNTCQGHWTIVTW